MRRALSWLAYLAGFAAFWLVLVGHLSAAEMIASAVAAILCVAVSKASSPGAGRPSRRWLTEIVLLPLHIAADSASFVRVLARRGRGEPSYGRDIEVELASVDEPAPSPIDVSIAVITTTLRPTSWVIDVAEDGRSMLVHRLSPQLEGDSRADGASG